MEVLILAILCVFVITGAHIAAPRLGILAPLLLVGFGVVVSLVPITPEVKVSPELILVGILPPLLYSAAVAMPSMDVRRDFQAISSLSVLLVVVSALVLGVFFDLLLPELDFAHAVALGAILSPTDAVATTTIKRIGAPDRLVTVLSGESLFNDASSLVILRAAIAASAMGISLIGTLAMFSWSILSAAAAGALVGILLIRVRSRITSPVISTALSFTTPYLAYVPAELMEGSGLVAAVVAGLITGRASITRLTASQRQSDALNWKTVEFLLEGGIFLLMGLELKALLIDNEDSGKGWVWALAVAGLALVLITLIRLAFVAPLVQWLGWRSKKLAALEPWLTQQQESLPPLGPGASRRERLVHRKITSQLSDIAYYGTAAMGHKEGLVVVWAGMRGVVTLAAAQTLPTDTPYRSLLILIAFFVAVGSLAIQGSTLGPIVSRLKFPDLTAQYDSERRQISHELAEATHAVLDDPAVVGDDPWLRQRVVVLREQIRGRPDADPAGTADDTGAFNRRRLAAGEIRRIRMHVIAAQRDRLIALRASGMYASALLADALAKLDAEEISLLAAEES